MGDAISEIAIRVESHEEVDDLTQSLKNEFKKDKLEALSWKEISPILLQWIEFDVAFINFVLFIVLLVVAAGILNTLLMGILERTREFGIMLSLGTKRAQIGILDLQNGPGQPNQDLEQAAAAQPLEDRHPLPKPENPNPGPLTDPRP